MRTALTVAVAAGLAATAAAQDSVSTNGLGDALDAYDATTAVTNYVVDTSPFATSWGTVFGIAPIIKSSNVNGDFFNNLMSAQAISKDLLQSVAPAASSYAVWTDNAGAGVNPTNNSTPMMVAAPALVNQQGVLFTDFGTTTSDLDFSGIVGGLVAHDPANPSRLYVTRVNAAVNGFGGIQDAAQFGVGSVDANGNAYFRADPGSQTDPVAGPNPVSGQNLLRARLADRTNGALSVVEGALGSIASADILAQGQGGVLAAPNSIPASVIGGNGAVATVTFNAEYVTGTNSISTSNDLLAPGAIDTRGALGTTTATPLGGSYTIAQLQKSPTDDTDSFAIHALDASGNIITPSSILLTVPASITDPVSGYTLFTAGGEFRQAVSQTAFRGGSGQIAVHEDRNGDLIVAATWHVFGLNNDPANALIVARVPAGGGATEWSIAAHSTDATFGTRNGKDLLDGPGGNSIANQIYLSSVTGGTPVGPSISAPTFDAAGNLWFVGAVQIPGDVAVDDDSALIRAVYNPATFGYELELVLEVGQVFNGDNSGLPYQISFVGIADNNSIDSGTIFSSNSSSRAFDDADISTLDQTDPRTNGGTVLNASITYDSNEDGEFDVEMGDERYSSLLYIGFTDEEVPGDNPGCNPADIVAPFGTLDLSDIDAFIIGFGSGDAIADVAAPFGTLDLTDIDTFIIEFGNSCP